MTKKSRTVLFFICFLLFALTAFLSIFYLQGYRIDWTNKKITRTGAFYFKAVPKTAEIYINGKLNKKTDFFSSAYVENLLPQKYLVEIKKEGYFSWKKNLEIGKKQVTEAKNIVLVPQNPNFTILNPKTKDFFFSPDNKKIALQETGPQGFFLKLFDIEGNVKSSLIEENTLKKYFITQKEKNPQLEFLNLNWSSDSKKILLNVAGAEQSKYFILEIDKTPLGLISLDFLGKTAENIQFYPTDSQKIFFAKPIVPEKKEEKSQIGLFNADYKNKTLSSALLSGFLVYQATEQNIFWHTPEGFLFKGDLSGKNQEKLNLDPLPLNEEEEIQFFIKESRILLKQKNTLYFFDNDSKGFKKISDSVKSAKFSGDLKKLVFFNDSEIWVLFLEKMEEQPPKKYLEQLFISRFSEKIDRVFWFTNHYLVLGVGNKIKISEIDERDQINIVDIKEIPDTQNLKIFYNQRDEKVYLLSNDNLSTSDKLIK